MARIVAATRQNAGNPRKSCPAGPDGLAPAEPGGVNAPASTTLASVMVVCGSAIDARLSHEAAAPRVRPPSIASSAADTSAKQYFHGIISRFRLPPSPRRGFGGTRKPSRPVFRLQTSDFKLQTSDFRLQS